MRVRLARCAYRSAGNNGPAGLAARRSFGTGPVGVNWWNEALPLHRGGTHLAHAKGTAEAILRLSIFPSLLKRPAPRTPGRGQGGL
jgi:hypothetical protein